VFDLSGDQCLETWFATGFSSELSVESVESPNGNGGIGLSYNLVDQVTDITQGSSSTSFTYDSLGRRVNEVAGGLTAVRHYTDSSDNPEWTSQLDGSNSTTEIYTGSLGAGMGITTTIKNGVTSAAMQITDTHGHTVNTINLTGTNTDYSSWTSYDSFGNPLTSQTNSNLINYSAYGQQERATNSTGLILMGARVYNPKTNQFTSIDPIPGGNENSYTYPNDPINRSDCSGLDEGLNVFLDWMGTAGAVVICVYSKMLLCWQGVTVSVSAATLMHFNDAYEKNGNNWAKDFQYTAGKTVDDYVSSISLEKVVLLPFKGRLNWLKNLKFPKGTSSKLKKDILKLLEENISNKISSHVRNSLGDPSVLSFSGYYDPTYRVMITSGGCRIIK